MNQEALSAIAELLGAIGVIVTLLYLSLQISHNSKQLEGSSTIAVHNYLRTLCEELCANPSLWATVRKANLDWTSLSEDERSVASLFSLKRLAFGRCHIDFISKVLQTHWSMNQRSNTTLLFSNHPEEENGGMTNQSYWLMTSIKK